MDDKLRYYLVTSITTKCPVCGDAVTETGKDAEDSFRASEIVCRKCGFVGELPQ